MKKGALVYLNNGLYTREEYLKINEREFGREGKNNVVYQNKQQEEVTLSNWEKDKANQEQGVYEVSSIKMIDSVLGGKIPSYNIYEPKYSKLTIKAFDKNGKLREIENVGI